MKLGGPEGGSEGQSFIARSRQQELDQLQDALIARHEQSQTPEAQEAREAQINTYMSDFDRMAQTRTNEQIDQLLRGSNTDVSEGSLRGEAYGRWKEQRARQAVEAASASDNVVSLEDHRKQKPDEVEPTEVTLAD